MNVQCCNTRESEDSGCAMYGLCKNVKELLTSNRAVQSLHYQTDMDLIITENSLPVPQDWVMNGYPILLYLFNLCFMLD